MQKEKEPHTYLLCQPVNNARQEIVLLPHLRCGYDKVYIMTKLLPPGDKDIKVLPTPLCQGNNEKNYLFATALN